MRSRKSFQTFPTEKLLENSESSCKITSLKFKTNGSFQGDAASEAFLTLYFAGASYFAGALYHLRAFTYAIRPNPPYNPALCSVWNESMLSADEGDVKKFWSSGTCLSMRTKQSSFIFILREKINTNRIYGILLLILFCIYRT